MEIEKNRNIQAGLRKHFQSGISVKESAIGCGYHGSLSGGSLANLAKVLVH